MRRTLAVAVMAVAMLLPGSGVLAVQVDDDLPIQDPFQPAEPVDPADPAAEDDDDDGGFQLPDGSGVTQDPMDVVEEAQDELEVQPCDPTQGVGGMTGAGSFYSDAGVPPTLLARFGTCGYTLHHRIEVSTIEGIVYGQDMKAVTQTTAADGMLSLAATVIAVVIAVLHFSFTADVGQFIDPAVGDLLSTLWRFVVSPFLVPAGIIGAFIIGSRLRRGEVTSGLSAFAILLAVTAIGIGMFTRSAEISSAVRETGQDLRRNFLSVVAYADPSSPWFAGQSYPYAGGPTEPDQAAWQVRNAEDQVWRIFIHTPWCYMQFGDTEVCAQYDEAILSSSTYNPEQRAAIAANPEAKEEIDAGKVELFEQTLERMEQDHPEAFARFLGGQTGDQLVAGVLTLVHAILGGLLHLIIGGAVIGTDIGFSLMLLIVMGSLILGATILGWGVTRAAILTTIGLVAAMALLSFFQSVHMFIVTRLLNLPADSTLPGGWLFTAVMSIAITFLAIKKRHVLYGAVASAFNIRHNLDPTQIASQPIRQGASSVGRRVSSLGRMGASAASGAFGSYWAAKGVVNDITETNEDGEKVVRTGNGPRPNLPIVPVGATRKPSGPPALSPGAAGLPEHTTRAQPTSEPEPVVVDTTGVVVSSRPRPTFSVPAKT